jgi:hypothetical protein
MPTELEPTLDHRARAVIHPTSDFVGTDERFGGEQRVPVQLPAVCVVTLMAMRRSSRFLTQDRPHKR